MKYLIGFFLIIFGSLYSEIIWEDNFESFPDWQLSGEFEIGVPQGLGGNYGNADPASAYEGLQVLGVDLSGTGGFPGDYEANLGEDEVYAISPLIDCSAFLNTQLSFMFWLNIEQSSYDHASIDVSNDNGTTWIELWTNTAGVENSEWSEGSYDLSSVADLSENTKIRFSIGPTDGSWQYSGWNIDSIVITGDPVIYGAIEGNVVDVAANEPVAFAQINSQFGNTIADEDGYFLLNEIPAGTRTLRINALGFYTYISDDIAVPENDTVYVNCEMAENPDSPPPPQNLLAEVYDCDNVLISWDAPETEEILLAYNVYRNGYLVASVLPLQYNDLNLPLGFYDYFVSAVYDMGESLPTTSVDIEVTGVNAGNLPSAQIEIYNYPNPFNPTTTIKFQSSEIGDISLARIEIYNLRGQKIRQIICDQLTGSQYTAVWNGDDEAGRPVSSGIYYYRLRAGEVEISKRCLLLK